MTQTARHDKKKLILEATLQLLASSGFHGFSMKQLATQAGVATGTIYLYFKDRDTLITELHSQIIHDFADAVFDDHDPQQPLKQQYQQICANVWHFCINHRNVTLSKAQFDHLPTDILRNQREIIWQRLQPLRDLFEQGRQQGLVKTLADDVLASLSFEPYTYMAGQYLLKVIDVNESELQQIMDASWDAIATNAGQAR